MVIHQATNFRIGTLLVKYLGVPFIARELSYHDCALLVAKIQKGSSIGISKTKFLSYARRLQLIQSVLCNVQNYWCKHFVLPKRMLRKITQFCSNFFGKEMINLQKELG